jgi:hypothetical protein
VVLETIGMCDSIEEGLRLAALEDEEEDARAALRADDEIEEEEEPAEGQPPLVDAF